MNNVLGLGIFAFGIILLILGFNESHSFSTEVAGVFSGNSSNHSVWLVAGGAIAVVGGLVLALRGARHD